MATRCERHGQVEVGVFEHNGHEYRALGASVVGRYVAAYTRLKNERITLTTWCGRTMLDCRCEVADSYSGGTLALMFRLTRKRFIVGYALADDGMLFRGELITDCDNFEAQRMARLVSQYWAERDTEDEFDDAQDD